MIAKTYFSFILVFTSILVASNDAQLNYTLCSSEPSWSVSSIQGGYNASIGQFGNVVASLSLSSGQSCYVYIESQIMQLLYTPQTNISVQVTELDYDYTYDLCDIPYQAQYAQPNQLFTYGCAYLVEISAMQDNASISFVYNNASAISQPVNFYSFDYNLYNIGVFQIGIQNNYKQFYAYFDVNTSDFIVSQGSQYNYQPYDYLTNNSNEQEQILQQAYYGFDPYFSSYPGSQSNYQDSLQYQGQQSPFSIQYKQLIGNYQTNQICFNVQSNIVYPVVYNSAAAAAPPASIVGGASPDSGSGSQNDSSSDDSMGDDSSSMSSGSSSQLLVQPVVANISSVVVSSPGSNVSSSQQSSSTGQAPAVQSASTVIPPAVSSSGSGVISGNSSGSMSGSGSGIISSSSSGNSGAASGIASSLPAMPIIPRPPVNNQGAVCANIEFFSVKHLVYGGQVLDAPYMSVIGLGLDENMDNMFLSTLAANSSGSLQKQWSYVVNPFNANITNITIGAIDQNVYSGDIVFHPVSNKTAYNQWALDLQNVMFANSSFQNVTYANFDINDDAIRLPIDIYLQFVEMLQQLFPDIVCQNDQYCIISDLCSNVVQDIGDLVFQFEDQHNYHLTGEVFLQDSDQYLQCLIKVKSQKFYNQEYITFGKPFFQAFYALFDLSQSSPEIGLALSSGSFASIQ